MMHAKDVAAARDLGDALASGDTERAQRLVGDAAGRLNHGAGRADIDGPGPDRHHPLDGGAVGAGQPGVGRHRRHRGHGGGGRRLPVDRHGGDPLRGQRLGEGGGTHRHHGARRPQHSAEGAHGPTTRDPRPE